MAPASPRRCTIWPTAGLDLGCATLSGGEMVTDKGLDFTQRRAEGRNVLFDDAGSRRMSVRRQEVAGHASGNSGRALKAAVSFSPWTPTSRGSRTRMAAPVGGEVEAHNGRRGIDGRISPRPPSTMKPPAFEGGDADGGAAPRSTTSPSEMAEDCCFPASARRCRRRECQLCAEPRPAWAGMAWWTSHGEGRAHTSPAYEAAKRRRAFRAFALGADGREGGGLPNRELGAG